MKSLHGSVAPHPIHQSIRIALEVLHDTSFRIKFYLFANAAKADIPQMPMMFIQTYLLSRNVIRSR
jgi:hypothetical protein